ncbi:MAG: Rrf2 family transcriptional regulator [Sedimentisphaerales bacterium]|nr:Rrf2 family transcriptional regulator [Sedimentisphaerales bacterium]
MKLSTRTRYGLRAILELAENVEKGPLQLRVIAQRQEISPKYLEQLITVLRSAGLVRSIRGAKGGYVLAKPPSKIRLDEVFNCLEGAVTTAECVDDGTACQRAPDCAARIIWTQVQQAVENVLKAVTLQDLIRKAKAGGSVNYQI